MPEKFAAGVRKVESGVAEGNYETVRGQVRGTAQRIGAYGIASDEWQRLAGEAGYPGARWQDSRAQDAIAMSAFNALYAKYKDWRLVAMAWKAGEAVADAVADNPDLLEDDKLAGLAQYADAVTEGMGSDPYPEQRPQSPGPQAPRGLPQETEKRISLSPPGNDEHPNQAKAQEALLGVLYMLRS